MLCCCTDDAQYQSALSATLFRHGPYFGGYAVGAAILIAGVCVCILDELELINHFTLSELLLIMGSIVMFCSMAYGVFNRSDILKKIRNIDEYEKYDFVPESFIHTSLIYLCSAGLGHLGFYYGASTAITTQLEWWTKAIISGIIATSGSAVIFIYICYSKYKSYMRNIDALTDSYDDIVNALKSVTDAVYEKFATFATQTDQYNDEIKPQQANNLSRSRNSVNKEASKYFIKFYNDVINVKDEIDTLSSAYKEQKQKIEYALWACNIFPSISAICFTFITSVAGGCIANLLSDSGIKIAIEYIAMLGIASCSQNIRLASIYEYDYAMQQQA